MQGDYEFENSSEEKKSRRKRPTKPQAVAFTVICAIIFGLVAGGVTFGVNFVGNRITASVQEKVESQIGSSVESDDALSELSENETADTAVSSGSASSSYASQSGMTVSQVADTSMSAMVTIGTISVEEMRDFFYGTRSYEVEGAGTGVIVGTNDTELLIATNNHVIDGATSVSVGFIDETSVEAYVKGTDSESDLAVVGVKLENISDETFSKISVITMGSSDDLVLGEQVVAIGNALGYGQSVTVGYISALNRNLTLTDNSGNSFVSSGLIQTDAAINSGNSGGALLNMKGELVGINEAKSSTTSSGVTVDGVGYAIPISKAEPILEELMAITTKDIVPDSEAGYLGVSCANVTSDIAEMYNMPVGVCFTNVLEGSPAEAAGAKKGDVLVEMEEMPIEDYDDLKNMLQYYAAGETVQIKVMRSYNGEYTEITLNVTLVDKTAIDALSAE